MSTPQEIDEAQASIDAVKRTESRLAGKMERPLWRHMIPAVLIGMVLFTVSLGKGISPLSLPVVVAAAVLISRHYKRQIGVQVSAFRNRTYMILTLVGMAVAIGALVVFRSFTPHPIVGQPQFWIVLGITIVALVALDVWRWEVLLRDIRGGHG